MSGLEKIREKIKSNELVVGTHVISSDAEISEMLACAGFDFVWIECEHGMMNKESVCNHVRAIQGRGAAAFVRVAWNDPALVKPYLEVGIDGVIFPMICSAEEARKAVAACTYPPAGNRGCGPMRASLHGLEPFPQYLSRADQSFWRIMQIEHVDAVHNLEEILQVEGVDAIVIGMFDLSGSIGLLGQLDHPEVVALLEEIAQKAQKYHVPVGLSSGYIPEKVSYWIDKGISWLSVGNDYEFMLNQAQTTQRECYAMYQKSLRKG